MQEAFGEAHTSRLGSEREGGRESKRPEQRLKLNEGRDGAKVGEHSSERGVRCLKMEGKKGMSFDGETEKERGRKKKSRQADSRGVEVGRRKGECRKNAEEVAQADRRVASRGERERKTMGKRVG